MAAGLLTATSPALHAETGGQGQWRTLTNQAPTNPVHVALMNTGEILIVSGSGNVATETLFQAAVWDLGAEHPDTLVTLNGLASLAAARHQYQNAEQLFEQLVVLRQRALGQDHPDTRATISELADMRKESGSAVGAG